MDRGAVVVPRVDRTNRKCCVTQQGVEPFRRAPAVRDEEDLVRVR
jgi:hypothetical protein